MFSVQRFHKPLNDVVKYPKRFPSSVLQEALKLSFDKDGSFHCPHYPCLPFHCTSLLWCKSGRLQIPSTKWVKHWNINRQAYSNNVNGLCIITYIAFFPRRNWRMYENNAMCQFDICCQTVSIRNSHAVFVEKSTLRANIPKAIKEWQIKNWGLRIHF